MSSSGTTTYYDVVRDPSTFAQRSHGRANLPTLIQRRGQDPWISAVSSWDVEHLFAHRVLCHQPKKRLAFLESNKFLPDKPQEIHSCLAALIKGPESIHGLKNKSEPELVRQYEPDSLGYVWAALALFERATEPVSPSNPALLDPALLDPALLDPAPPTTPKRERKKPETYGQFVPSDKADLGSSPIRPKTSGGGSLHSNLTYSSMGYIEKLEAPLVEDASVRLASCFIRTVLNYGQPLGKSSPYWQFRDQRQAYSHSGDAVNINAIDDGGVYFVGREEVQVAMLEGKRTFAQVVDGSPVVSDKLLAQIVGEVMALGLTTRAGKALTVSEDSFVVIHTVMHCVKFFYFKVPDDLFQCYENLVVPSQHSYLALESTVWYDLKQSDHRKEVVCHILALGAWVDSTS